MKSIEPIKILIIEDNMGDFLLIRDYLEEQIKSPEITHVLKFSEVSPLVEEGLEFDVILLDLTLPDKTGETLISEVVNLFPNAPIIILTGFSDIDFSIKSLTLKVSDYLLKDDITPVALYKSIKYNIERKKSSLLLEESEKRYSNLFQLSPQPMWISDTINFNFVQVNRAAIDHYGYSESEFINMSLFDIIDDDISISEKREKAFQFLNIEKVYKGRFRHIKKSREIIEVDIYSNLIEINEQKFESIIAIDVTEKIRLDQKITKAIIKTQEDERFEIGTELHDNICQILASSQLSLDMLKDKLPPESSHWFNKSKQYINLALEEIRNISHRLAPSFFDDTTIEDTFQELIDSFNIENKYETTLKIDFSAIQDKINSEIRLNLFRILQEQMRNIIKYANATKINISIEVENHTIKFIIADNGIGFDYNLVKKGIGLANMKRRVELFSGNLEIESKPGLGCKIICYFPYLKSSTALYS